MLGTWTINSIIEIKSKEAGKESERYVLIAPAQLLDATSTL